MKCVSLEYKGTCLIFLGRLLEAEKTYNAGLKISEKLDNKREVAVIKGQLGTVYLRQEKYKEAIAAHEDAKNSFEQLGEFQMMSVAYHQIGMVYEETDNFKEAEKAYRQSLAIEIKIKNKDGEASSLGQLGLLYKNNGYLEETVTFLRQACDIYVVLEDLHGEGRQRNNLADTLIELKRYDEARDEIKRAIECKSHFGHAARPWTSFAILHNLESATGKPKAAEQAWGEAFSAYLSYRKDGGYGQSNSSQIVEMFKNGIQQGNSSELETMIEQAANSNLPENTKFLFSILKLILEGNWDISLATDYGLSPMDAV